MFGKRVTLFRLFGFEVRLDASWIVIALLVTWSLAVSVFPVEYPELPIVHYWAMGFVGAIGLFACIVFHELCHSLVARLYGIHMKGITLFIFGGMAELGEEPGSAKAEFLMAVAGPVASFVLAGVFFLLRPLITRPVEAAGVIAYLAWINVALACFNLIPAFPLDGGRILRAALWRWKGDLTQATRISTLIGSGFGALLMGLGVLRMFTGDLIGALWTFVIGMFIRSASRSSYEQMVVQNTLQGEPVERFMRLHPVSVTPDLNIADLVENYLYRHHYRLYPVVDEEGTLLGCVGAQAVREVPRDKWPWRQVRHIMQECGVTNTVDPHTDAMAALKLMSGTGNSRLMVVDHGHLVGMLTLRDLLGFLRTKLQLQGGPDGTGRTPGLISHLVTHQ